MLSSALPGGIVAQYPRPSAPTTPDAGCGGSARVDVHQRTDAAQGPLCSVALGSVTDQTLQVLRFQGL